MKPVFTVSCVIHGDGKSHHRTCPICAADQAKVMHIRILAGETAQAISEDYGISRERVRQIVTAIDPQAPKLGKAVRREQRRVRIEVERAKRQAAKPPPGPIHGTTTGYTWRKCRCDDCRAAWLAYRHVWQARQTGVPPGTPHGRPSTYRNYRCRCDECRAAHVAQCKAYKARRRLQTLEVA